MRVPLTTKYIVITGANSGIGYSLTKQLLQSSLKNKTPTVILMACRSIKRAEIARSSILSSVFGKETLKFEIPPEESLVIVPCDLSSSSSVIDACNFIKRRIPRIDSLILNAGCIPLVGLNFAVGNFVDFLMRPSWVLTTGGNFMKQSLGQVTKDGLGFAFAANVFGHYIMFRELEDLLSLSILPGGSRVLWTSSSSGSIEKFSLNDIQGIETAHSYESSKYLTNLLTHGLSQSQNLKEKNINVFNCNPGAVATNIINGLTPVWLVALVLYSLRFFFVRELNIRPDKATTSMLYLVEHGNPDALDKTKQYVSDSSFFGKGFVGLKDVVSGNEASSSALIAVEKLENLYIQLSKNH